MTTEPTLSANRLRFRAWDKNGKWMSVGTRENFDDMIAWRFSHWEPETDNVEGLPDVVLMQSLGFKDKNGKEVYESDIDKSGFPIEWFRGGFICNGQCVGNDCSNGEDTWVEIIGNIHQNPELLPTS